MLHLMCYQVLLIYSLDETNLYLDSTFLITFIKIRNYISINELKQQRINLHCPSEIRMLSSGGEFFINICALGNSVCNRCVNAPILSYSKPR